MKVIITEDIVRNALNESIDEFMLEEGMLGNGFKSLQNWWNNSPNAQKIKNAGNSLWNGVKMYMDYRTNGQWNNKYGQYANGAGRTTEMYYLNKWFNYHLNEIKDVARYSQNPNRAQKEIEWKYNEKGEQVGTQKISNYGSIEEYVSENINPQNFNLWIRNYIQDRKALQCIDNYIIECYNEIKDLNSAIKKLSVYSFMESDAGKEYIADKKNNLQQSSVNAQTNINKETSYINDFFSKLVSELNNYSSNPQALSNYMSNGGFNMFFNAYFKNYLNSYDKLAKQRISLVYDFINKMWGNYSMSKSPSNIIKQLNLKTFKITQQGKQYDALAQQAINM